VSALLKTNEWHHIAAVTGKGGMKLFFDGVEVATNNYTGSFSTIKNGTRFRLGRSVVDDEPHVDGQLDEVRVWKVARTESQIRENLLKTLNGNEPGLAGLWNFNDGTANDSSPGRHHGTLQGNARVVAARRLSAQEFIVPAMITGKVADAEGRPLRNADVVLLQNGAEVIKARSSIAGEYRLQVLKPNDQPYDVRVTRENLGDAITGLSLAAGGKKTLDFTLYEAPAVFGSILTAEKSPRAGVKVQLESGSLESRLQPAQASLKPTPADAATPDRLKAGLQTNIAASTLSNVRGEYRFKNVVPGSYRVKASGADGPVYFAEGKVIVVAQRTRPNRADIQLPAPTSASAPVSTNQVLQLGGGGSYVELPSNIFNDLEEATVEGWVRWDRIGNWMRFFDFGKQAQAMLIGNRETSSDLAFELWNAEGKTQGLVTAPALIQSNRWCHLAVVTGKGGVRVYFNGLFVATHSEPGSFTAVKNGDHNYLGKNNFKGFVSEVEDLDGAMDEVRVWVTQRSETEIRDNMFKRLTGREDGLAGLWNFDDPARPGRDSTPNHFEGQLKGNTDVAPAVMSAGDQLGNPTVLVGKVTDAKGELLSASASVEQEGQLAKQANADAKGEVRFLLSNTNTPYTLSAQASTSEGRRLNLFLTNLVFQPGETRLDLKLREFASLSGKVVAFDQTPLEAVVVQAITEPPPFALMTNGLLGEYFRLPSRPESFPELPADATPVVTNRVHKIDFPNGKGWLDLKGAGNNEAFYGRWTGTFTLDQPRRITFHLVGGPGARLFIDDKTVIDLGVSGQGSEQTESVNLEPGEHRVKIDALRRTVTHYCVLTWQVDGYSSIFPVAEPAKSTTLTDEKGEFRFGELPPARYRVRAQVPGEYVYAEASSPARGLQAASPGTRATVLGNAEAENQSNLKRTEVRAPDHFEVKEGVETRDVDFEIAPFKKGNWKTYTRMDGWPTIRSWTSMRRKTA